MAKPQIDTNDPKVQEAAAVLIEAVESGDEKAIKAIMRQFGLAAVKWGYRRRDRGD
jgi:hypothetical protein